MIEEKTFKEIMRGRKGSFAIWPPRDDNDFKKVDVPEELTEYEKIKDRLKPHIIFVAMNMAKKDDKPFANFHSTEKSHNDYRLRDAINSVFDDGSSTPFFEGAYMTDFFNFPCPRAKCVKCHFHNQKALEAAVAAFVEECNNVCQGEKYIISIGTGFHYEIIKKYLKNEQNFNCLFSECFSRKPCFYIPHHSGAAGKTDMQYTNEAKDQLTLIMEEIKRRHTEQE